MSAEFTIHEAKTRLSRLLERGAAGERITFSKAGPGPRSATVVVNARRDGSGYRGCPELRNVADIWIRDVSEATVAGIDRRAAEQGLSRAEYLRRRLDAEYHPRPAPPMTSTDWRRFHGATTDLADPDVMGGAWS